MEEMDKSLGVERSERGNLVIEDIPEIPGRIVERMLQYLNTRSANIHDWHPDTGGMLVSTRFGETTQLHLVEKPGGARRQLTFFPEPIGDAAVCPHPDRNGFLFSKDVCSLSRDSTIPECRWVSRSRWWRRSGGGVTGYGTYWPKTRGTGSRKRSTLITTKMWWSCFLKSFSCNSRCGICDSVSNYGHSYLLK